MRGSEALFDRLAPEVTSPPGQPAPPRWRCTA